MTAWLGVIADDFTGATDLAGMLVREGHPSVQYFGVPGPDASVPDADCLVVALKSRSISAADAVEQSLAAAAWLLEQGVGQLFFKYCSTFDSTAEGNIGAVAEALAELTGSRISVIAPAVPENGRTVYQGHLFVHSEPLDESPLRNHPLNPMRDSSLIRLFEEQATTTAALVPLPVVAAGAARIAEALDAAADAGHRFAVVDTVSDENLIAIGEAIAGAPLVTGAAGLALGLARARQRGGSTEAKLPVVPSGPAVVLSGSCSTATQQQLALHRATHPAFELDPRRLAVDDASIAEALAFAEQHLGQVPIIYSSANAADVESVQEELGTARAAALIEGAFARIASGLVERGVRRILVAGGETSGAVVTGIGTRAISIGAEVDPGVPWTVSVEEPQIGLLLKSGNFGSVDVFEKALRS
jgi:uncharacterized protein YgbK (DUF1537 family)